MSPPATATLLQRLRGMTRGDGLRAQLVRGGMGSGAVMALNRLLRLALGIVLARGLGAEGYGIYAYAFAIMSLLMVAGEAGVPTLLMREVAASQGREEWGLLRGALIRGGQFVALASISVSAIGLLVLWMMADRLNPAEFYTALFMLLLLPLSALAKTVAHAMRGLHRVGTGQAVDMLLRPALALVGVGTVFFLFPDLRRPQVAMAAQLGAVFVVLVTGAIVLKRFLPDGARTHPAEYRGKAWLKSALPFTLIGGAGLINNQADIIMLGWFRPVEEVGLYRVAVQGATLVAFGLWITGNLIAPHFASLYAQGDMVRLQRMVTASARAILLIALPVALAFIFAGGAIMGWVFGAEFQQTHLPLAILTVGHLVSSTMGSVAALMTMTGHENDAARTLWQTALLNIVLNAILIPLYGTPGAAAASGISLITWNTLLYKQVQRSLGLVSTAFKTI